MIFDRFTVQFSIITKDNQTPGRATWCNWISIKFTAASIKNTSFISNKLSPTLSYNTTIFPRKKKTIQQFLGPK